MHFRLSKTTVVYELHIDCEVGLKFVNQYLHRMCDRDIDPTFLPFGNEANSFLWIYDLNRLKSAGKPILIYSEPISYIMVGVWSAKTTSRITGNIIFFS